MTFVVNANFCGPGTDHPVSKSPPFCRVQAVSRDRSGTCTPTKNNRAHVAPIASLAHIAVRVVHLVQMEALPRCFVAYPSTPPARAETVEQAIATISHNGVVEIKG
jgi:hypothetical protein